MPQPGQALAGCFSLKGRFGTQQDTFFVHCDNGLEQRVLIKLVEKGSKNFEWRWGWWCGILPRSCFSFHKEKAKKGIIPFVLQTSFKYIRKKIHTHNKPPTQTPSHWLVILFEWSVGGILGSQYIIVLLCTSRDIRSVCTWQQDWVPPLPMLSVGPFPSKWLLRGFVQENSFAGTQKWKHLWNYSAQITWHWKLEQLANLCDEGMLNVKQLENGVKMDLFYCLTQLELTKSIQYAFAKPYIYLCIWREEATPKQGPFTPALPLTNLGRKGTSSAFKWMRTSSGTRYLVHT